MTFRRFYNGQILDADDLNYNFDQIATVSGVGDDAAATAYFTINGASLSQRKIFFQTAGTNRFAVGMNGSNNFVIERYDGSGAYVNNAFRVNESTGALTLLGATTFGDSATNNAATLTYGAGASNQIVFSQSGTGGFSFVGDTAFSSKITVGNITPLADGSKFFDFGYSKSTYLVDIHRAGSNADGAKYGALKVQQQVTHDGASTGGNNATAALYASMDVQGQPEQDYWAGGFLTYIKNLKSATAAAGESQHGGLYSQLVKVLDNVPGGVVGSGEQLAEGWVQWWVMSDRTGLASSKSGASVGLELDIDGNGDDDDQSRFVAQYVINNYAKDALSPYKHHWGLYFNSGTGGVNDSLYGVPIAIYAGYSVAGIDFSQGTGPRADPYVDATNRAVGIKFRDGIKFGWTGDGATGTYFTHGSSKLQYWSGGSEVFSISDTGKLVSASTATDSFTFPGGGNIGPDDFRQIEIMQDGATTGTTGSPTIMFIRRVGSTSAAASGTDTFVVKNQWTQTSTTPGTGVRFNTVIATSQGSGVDPGETWGFISIIDTQSATRTNSRNAVAGYFQANRRGLPGAGEPVSLEGLVIAANDMTNANSTTSGKMRTLELDMFAGGADDITGIGREVIPVVLGKFAAGDTSPTFTSLLGVYPVIGDGVTLKRGIGFYNALDFSQSLFDTRDAVQGASANAFWLKAGHRIALDGDTTAAATASTNYIYSSSGSLKIHSPTVILADGATAPFTVTSGNITAATNQNSTLATGGVGYYWAVGRSGYGNVFQAQINANGTNHGGSSPNELLVPARLKVGMLTTAGTTYTLSGSVVPSSVVGDGTTVVVTYPSITNRVLPVGSTMTLAGWSIGAFNGTWTVAASDNTTATLTCAATGTPTGGTVTYNMAPITPFSFGSNWAGKPTAAKVVPYRFSISSDTADTAGTLSGMPVVGIYHNWSGAATGGKHGLEVEISQTGPTNDPRVAGIPNQQHTVINAHAWGKYNAGGTGTFANAAGSLYGLNPQTKLLAGATHWRLINALGEINSSVAASSVDVTVGGTITASDTVSLQFASTDIAGTPVTATWTVGASQTLAMVANNLAAEVNATTALRDAGISAISNTDGTLTIYWPTFLATLTITPSTSGGATETLTLGTPISGASVDIKTLGAFIRLVDDHGRGEMNSAMLIFGAQSGAARSGDYLVGLNFGSLDGYDGQWPLHEHGSLISARYQTGNGGSAKNAPLSSPILDHGIDLRYVDFGVDAWRSPGVQLTNSKVVIGGHQIYADGNGLNINAIAANGNTASAVTLASGGGGGAGSAINNYFKTDRGYVSDGVLEVTSVDPSTGAVSAFNVKTYPSHNGTAPTNPVAVEGGSGINWTVNITWPAAPELRLQSAGGRTRISGSQGVATRTHTAAGAVTVAADTDHIVFINKTVGAATIVNLPSSPTNGDTYVIRDAKGDAAANNITITPASGTINGAATLVINTNNGGYRITYDGSEWKTTP